MGWQIPTVHTLRDQARDQPTVLLARVESHWVGMALGLGSAALALLFGQLGWMSSGGAVAWLPVVGMLLGMLLHWRWKKTDAGWHVDFAQRQIAPQGISGEATKLEGQAWQVQVGPGEFRRIIAIDLRHPERGRVARLYESPARSLPDQRALSELADVLARRLRAERSGPRIE
jgi:hypothetical protein